MLKPQIICIDGLDIPFQSGETVLQAALTAGLNIPYLCYRAELGPIGSCRLCLVSVAGRTVSACTLAAVDGQVIASNNPALKKYRTQLVTWLLEQGRHTCIQCERSGDCRLQESAAALAVSAINSPENVSIPAVDASHPTVALNRGRCILCGICVQASRELDGKNLFALAGYGSGVSLVVDSPLGLLVDSGIEASDYAVRLCPVGALTVKANTAIGLDFTSFDFFA